MSVILTARNSKIAMAAPGRPMLAAPLSSTGGGTGGGGGTVNLASVALLTGWWDAGVVTNALGTTGTPLSAFGSQVGAVADKSGTANTLTVWHHASSGTNPPTAAGHLNGLLGGIGLNMIVPPAVPTPGSGQQLPLMDPDQGLISAAMTIGSGAAWTVFLVWSRPNWRQNSTAASTLLSVSGTPVLAADNSAGTGRLVLFPGAQQTVLSSALTRRHTHAVLLRNTPGVGVDVWLDAMQVAAAAPNPLAATLSAPLLFLHNGASNGGAECWFHEAAVWGDAVASTGIATIQSYQSRWRTGVRKGIQILVSGQSNSGNALNDGAWHLLAQGVAWHLGALGFGVVGNYGSQPAATCIHGEGIYPLPALGFSGSFLNDPNDGSDPSTWSFGGDGLAVQTWIRSDAAAEDVADIVAILWPWSENDSCRQYSEKATYEAAARRLLSLERGVLSRTPANLPHCWWSAIPFPYNQNDPGTQAHREVVANMVADPTQNVTVVLLQTSDSLPRSIGGPPLVYNATTGVWSGGDPLHRDIADNQRFGRLAAPLIARAVLAAEGGDTLTSLPAGIPSVGGPVVSHVYRQSGTSLVVTVQHDCGTDLIVPATLAATGIGWAVMDGGSVASPGTIVTATACVRLNATQLQITLTQALVNLSANCRLFYPYGTGIMGRGNAVTDNLSLVVPPQGWNIAGDLGSGWSLNMPVHVPMMTASGLVLSDTPT
jgi:hypothetical protein